MRVRALVDGSPGERFVLVYGDIDRFKAYNDLFGTPAGDRLLADIGGMLRGALPKGAVAARLRADHFVCCCTHSSFDPDETLAALDAWFASYRDDFTFFVRLGIYVIDEPDLDVGLMCDRALLALRAAKSDCVGSKYAFYDEGLRSSLLKEQQLAGEMISALEQGQFVPYFQPQYHYPTGRMIGAEVLARWSHPEKGLLGPLEFIPVFERNGLIATFDFSMWEAACRCLRSWIDRRGVDRTPRLSVNLSRADIYRTDLCAHLSSLVERYRIPPSLLHLEITEGVYIEVPEQLIDVVERLHEAGFIVEMDDFGSGFSSLNTLKDVPVDVLKLDMGFLGTCESARGGIILASVVRMARWLGLPVIAEGVETQAQADYLASVGCERMQGYLFSRPVDQAAFERMLDEAGADGLEHPIAPKAPVVVEPRAEELDGAGGGASRGEEPPLCAPDQARQRLYDAIPCGIVRYTAEARPRVVSTNRKACELLGYASFEEYVAESAGDALMPIHEDDACQHEAVVARLKQGSGPIDFCYRYRRRDGSIGWIEGTSALETALDGTLLVQSAFIDVTDKRQRSHELDLQRYAQILRAVYEEIFELDERSNAFRMLYSTRRPDAASGTHPLDEELDRWMERVSDPVERAALRKAIEDCGSNETGKPLICTYKIKQGDAHVWCQSTFIKVSASSVLCCNKDVTERLSDEGRKRAWQDERYRLLSEMTHKISFDYDSDADTVLLYIDLTGEGTKAQVIPHYMEELAAGRSGVMHPDSVDDVRQMFEKARRGANQVGVEYRADYYGRGYAWYRANLFVAHDEAGAWHLVGLIENIDDERDLRYRAEYDATTGLSNHATTQDLVAAALADPAVREHSVCVALDIDEFKQVNDLCGHMEGDMLLHAVGAILRANFRASDIIGRVGGDEFVMLLKRVDLDVALRKLEDVRAAIAATPVTGFDRAPSVSMGVYATRDDDRAYRDVFVKADEALYRAKRAGKNRIEVHEG